MLLRRWIGALALASVFLAASFPAFSAGTSQERHSRGEGKAVLWQEHADIASLNLLLGPGGEAMKPDLSKVTFLKEEEGGYSKKYRVSDGAGRIWIAKLSKEAQSEIAASRLLWAAGYFTDISYLAPSLTIEGKGTFENVRLEARPREMERMDTWKWDSNPFMGSRQFQGLKVMMVLFDNWDIKDSNNRIVVAANDQTGDIELRYIISDLGATLGKTGGIISRTRNEPADFVNAKFIDEIKGNRVDFHYSGKRKDVFNNITVAEAKWIGQILSRLSDEQISDAFRAANYSAQEVEMLAGAVRSRINELVGLPRDSARRIR